VGQIFDFLKVIVRVCHAGRIDQYVVYMGLMMLKFFPCVYIYIHIILDSQVSIV